MKYMLQIWKAVNYLRIIGIVHLDIRPENLYLSSDRDNVKLVDFTCAQVLTLDGDFRVYQQTKCIDFLSPEQVFLNISRVYFELSEFCSLLLHDPEHLTTMRPTLS